jgi:thiopurine S-methyltransferase
MPPEMQPKYAAKLAELMPAGAPVLLIGLDYDPSEMQGPPFAIPQARVQALFEKDFDVVLLEARDGLTKAEHLKKRGVTRLEEAAYLMRRRA